MNNEIQTDLQAEKMPWCTDYAAIQRKKRIERLAEIAEELTELKIIFDARIKHRAGYEDVARKMEALRNESAGLSVATQF